MKILFVDTETTGLPKKRNDDYKNTNNYDTARLMQIGMILYDEENNSQKYYKSLVKLNENVDINPFAMDLHGITWEQCNQNGKTIGIVLAKVKLWMDDANLIVAHNIKFDIGVIASEFYRLRLVKIANRFFNKPQFCTMRENGGKKLQTVARSYDIEHDHLKKHDALDDAFLCKSIYLARNQRNDPEEYF